jgi:hypothetical protein
MLLNGRERMPAKLSLETFMASNASTDGDSFVESARLIAGDNPPRWLVRHLHRWSSSILLDIAVHARQPGRAAVRERLKKLVAGAELQQRELQDVVITEFLQTDDLGPILNLPSLIAALQDIQRRAQIALSSASLSTKSGKTKAGARRALPPNAGSPRAFCAGAVLEAWAHFHGGKHPAASNLELATAADEYWRACGGIAEGWGQSRLKAWRPYFKEASTPPLAKIRKELRGHMLLSAEHDR